MMKTVAIAALLLPALPVPTAAPLPPTGKWIVNYADNMCVLSHDFGSAAAMTSLGFKPVPLGAQTEVVLITPGAIPKARIGKATVTMGPSGQIVTSSFGQVPLPKQGRSGTQLQLDADAAPLLENATTMTIALPGSTTSVALPNIKPALAALRACQDELLGEWGVDAHERDLAATPAKPANNREGISDWLTSDDYPKEAIDNSQQGAVLILWSIGIDGRAHDCRVIQSSGVPVLDKASCTAIATRARYAPARDKDGKAMVTHATRRIVWIKP